MVAGMECRPNYERQRRRVVSCSHLNAFQTEGAAAVLIGRRRVATVREATRELPCRKLDRETCARDLCEHRAF